MKNISELNKLKIRLFIEAVLNDGRLELIDELIAADFVGHLPGAEPDVTGPAGVRRFVSSRRRAHPGLYVKIEDQIAEDDRVVTRWRATVPAREARAPLAPAGAPRATPESRSPGCWPESKSTPTPNAPSSPPARPRPVWPPRNPSHDPLRHLVKENNR